MWHLQSPLRCGIFKARYDVASLKARYDVASSKPATMRHLLSLLHGNIFTKSYKAQMLIWHYFTKPNINLALFYRAQILFWQLFHKTQMLFWHIFTKFKYYFNTCLHILNLSLMGNIIIHPSRNTSLTRFIKVHVYHPWQNYSFCRDSQIQGSLTIKPSWASLAYTTAGDHVS